ncbi:CoA-dependent acyltransferase [Armillaria solidipes]|uniref:CoA-dependent acyltransferase n=1 Tax=Armillaria solidipes TaxID=1076256 RepID=A0A2H3B1W2_9AGAR|nr:CoA-dependent acyltransferase [Armillaria solidipes]
MEGKKHIGLGPAAWMCWPSPTSCIYLPIGYEIPAFRKRLLFRAGGASLVFATASCADDFVSVEPAKIVDIDDVQHVQQISRYPASAPAYPAPEVACIMFGDGHLSTSCPCFVSLSSLVASIEAFAYKLHRHHSLNDAGEFLSWLPLSCDGHLLELLLPLCTGMAIASVSRGLLQDGCPTVLNNTGVTYAILLPTWLERKGVRPCDVPRLQCAILTGYLSHFPLLDEWTEPSDLTVLSVNQAFGLSDKPSDSIKQRVSALWEGTAPRRQTGMLGTLSGTIRLPSSAPNRCSPYFGVKKDRYVLATCRVQWDGSSLTPLMDPSSEQVPQPVSELMNEVFLQERKLDLAGISDMVSPLAQQGLNVHTLALDHPEGLQTYVITFNERRPTSGIVTEHLHNGHSTSSNSSLYLSKPTTPALGSRYDNTLGLHPSRQRLLFAGEQLPIPSPRTALEKEICNVISGVTQVPVDAMNADTITLELGIDSLSAISLSFQMKAAGFFVPPHVILTGPSVSKLAKSSRSLIEDRNPVSSWEMETRLEERVRDSLSNHHIQLVQPCLPLQEGLVAHTLNSAEPIYVNHFILRIGEADRSQLRKAIDETIAANVFLFQVVLSRVPNNWTVVEVSDGEDPLVILRRDMRSVELDVVQSVGTQPPIRLALYSSKDGTTFLRLTMHHAIYDGESLPMLLSEIYECHLAHQSQELSRSFYSDYLDNAPKPALTHTYGSLESNHQRYVLDVPLLHVLALSAFGIALGEYQKRNDSIFGVVLSGRTLLVDGVDNMLAPCITTVPVRVRAVDGQIFADITRQVQVNLSSVMEYQHTPLHSIQRWLGSGEQLFDTLFNFNRVTTSLSSSHNLWSVLKSKAAIDYPLAVAFEASPSDNTATLLAGYTSSFGLSTSVASLLSQILVRDMVAKLCNVDPTLITKDLSFLHLGVDSITIIRLAQQLRAEGFVVHTFATMRHPCIGELVNYANESSADMSLSADVLPKLRACCLLWGVFPEEAPVVMAQLRYLHVDSYLALDFLTAPMLKSLAIRPINNFLQRCIFSSEACLTISYLKLEFCSEWYGPAEALAPSSILPNLRHLVLCIEAKHFHRTKAERFALFNMIRSRRDAGLKMIEVQFEDRGWGSGDAELEADI